MRIYAILQVLSRANYHVDPTCHMHFFFHGWATLRWVADSLTTFPRRIDNGTVFFLFSEVDYTKISVNWHSAFLCLCSAAHLSV